MGFGDVFAFQDWLKSPLFCDTCPNSPKRALLQALPVLLLPGRNVCGGVWCVEQGQVIWTPNSVSVGGARAQAESNVGEVQASGGALRAGRTPWAKGPGKQVWECEDRAPGMCLGRD